MRRLSITAVSVLGAIADGFEYGFDVIDTTGLPSGTVYPALSRLERDGYVRSAWEDERRAHQGRPPRATVLPRDSRRRPCSRGCIGLLPQPDAGHPIAQAATTVMDAGSTTVRICARLLQAAAPLAPSDVRRDWLREWDAEMHYAARRLAQRESAARGAHAWLVVRCGGAFLHAAWLRWDRWRLEMLLQDVKYALRTLTRKPGFAVITVLTLAVGIGANAAIFSAVRAVLLRPLPFPAPEQLVQLFSTTVRTPERAAGTASPPDFVDWRRDNSSFIDLAAINAGSYALTGLGAAEQVSGANVTGGFFNVLGVPALFGRTLLPEDDAMGSAEVAVLGHGLWTRRFGSDPAVLGRTITIDGEGCSHRRRHAARVRLPAAVGDLAAATVHRRRADDAARRALSRRDRPAEARSRTSPGARGDARSGVAPCRKLPANQP